MVFSDKWHDSEYTILDTFPGIIMLNSCDNISFSNNIIRHTGAEGIVMDNDAVECSIIGNVFEDIAGSAVDVGNPQHVYIGDGGENEKYQPDEEGACIGITISNNFISDPAVMFPGHAGVTVYFSDTLTFTHNIIKNTPYNGISFDWGWWNFDGSSGSVEPRNPTTVCRNNNISYNMFIDTMQTLSDAGAIYTLGSMPDSVIKGNYITGIPSGDKRYGLHQDEGSAYMTISDNVIDTSLYACDSVHVGTWGSQHNLVYTNNYATLGTYYDINVPNSSFEPLKTYSDAFWPDEAYKIILTAGVEPEYQSIIDTEKVSLADILFPADMKTYTDEISIRSADNDEYTIWLAPYNTTRFLEGNTMTKAVGTDTKIKTPVHGESTDCLF